MYTARIQNFIEQAGKKCTAYGVDVSKTAVRMAAKRHKAASFAVASSYALPFENQAITLSSCALPADTRARIPSPCLWFKRVAALMRKTIDSDHR